MQSNSYTCFDGNRLITTGSLPAVALVVKRITDSGASGPILIFDNSTGRSRDLDTRGTDDEVSARMASATTETCESAASERETAEPRGRGRPKLGVVAREVTLLPRHWEWLATQPGGASVALRKLVEEARRTHADKDRAREAQERAYHFMSVMAGDLPGFEEAIRALFAGDRTKLGDMIGRWPDDIRSHAIWLAYGD